MIKNFGLEGVSTIPPSNVDHNICGKKVKGFFFFPLACNYRTIYTIQKEKHHTGFEIAHMVLLAHSTRSGNNGESSRTSILSTVAEAL